MEKRKVLIDFCEWCNKNNKYDFIYKSIIDEYLQSINSVDEQQDEESKICHWKNSRFCSQPVKNNSKCLSKNTGCKFYEFYKKK
jgi:hypothetical protein